MNLPTLGILHSLLWRKTPRLCAVMVVTWLGMLATLPAFAADIDDARMLQAIATWENSAGRVGEAGERGIYQMHPLTVRDRGGWGEQHARAHLQWIKANLRRARVDVLPYNVALVWNAGLATVLSGRAKERHYTYARAVDALYDTLPAGRSAAGNLGVGSLHSGMSPAGSNFVPVPNSPSGASLAEQYEIAALCSGAGVSPDGLGGLGLQMHVSPSAIPCEVARVVESRTGWPCRDNGQFSSATITRAGFSNGTLSLAGVSDRGAIGQPSPLSVGRALPLSCQFRAAAAMPGWQRAPLAEAAGAIHFMRGGRLESGDRLWVAIRCCRPARA
jgi:hypothetical protein